MKATPVYQLRIIDANLNRAGEGLRVLEEFARLSLNDAGLTRRLKDLRHKTLRIDAELQQRFIGARDAAGDVGAGMATAGQEQERNAVEMIIANARRAQESLRVLEEIAKEPGLKLQSRDYEEARFDLYTIEKELLGKMLRRDAIKRIKGLYVIIDVEFLKGRSAVEVTGAAIRGGAKVIQLRDKKDSARGFYNTAVELRKLCKQRNIPFIVNDSLEVALAANADGLHVGNDDLPAATARKLLPVDKILGVSASTLEEAKAAQEAGADYIGAGAMFPTGSKAGMKVPGPRLIKEIKKSVKLPVAAIGGINQDNVGDVLEAGADAVAVISAVMGAEDTEKAARELAAIIEGEKHG